MDTMLLGSSRCMQAVRAQLEALAALPWHVRIEGPTGTGKGVAARELHRRSLRHVGPFIECSVNALPDGIEVAELVGHVRGSYTGAVSDAAGFVEAAHGGTLFIDEVGTASARTQLALLQLVDEGRVQRLGERRVRKVDVRIVFATNANLESLVASGQFRPDLLQRMGVLVLRMPPLVEHRDDIPEYVARALAERARELGRKAPPLPREAMDRLRAYDWPGNVRQLEEVMKYWVAFGELPDVIRRPGRGLSEWLDELPMALRRNDGSVAAVARELGVSRKAVYRGIKRLRDSSVETQCDLLGSVSSNPKPAQGASTGSC